MFSFLIQSLKFFNSTVQNRVFKKEQKPLRLFSTLKTLTMMESATSELLVSALNRQKHPGGYDFVPTLLSLICFPFAVEDGRMMADAEAGEFWGLFGGFAPLPKKPAVNDDITAESDGIKLFR